MIYPTKIVYFAQTAKYYTSMDSIFRDLWILCYKKSYLRLLLVVGNIVCEALRAEA